VIVSTEYLCHSSTTTGSKGSSPFWSGLSLLSFFCGGTKANLVAVPFDSPEGLFHTLVMIISKTFEAVLQRWFSINSSFPVAQWVSLLNPDSALSCGASSDDN
jgi:hypothetical protein